MKRVLSLAIVLMLAFSCVFTAFAQTDDTASPDEAKKVTELKITKLPDKLTYTSEDVIEPDIDLSSISVSSILNSNLTSQVLKLRRFTVTVQPKRLMLRTAKLSLLIRLITAK